MRIALFQPDIAPNVGTILRLGACLGVPVDIIEPCGFPLGEKTLRRAGMDYIGDADMRVHDGWESFTRSCADPARLILLTTRGDTPYTAFPFAADDILVLGRESAGVPECVHDAADARIVVPMAPGLRSLNVAIAAGMVLGEALRQTAGFPATGHRAPATESR